MNEWSVNFLNEASALRLLRPDIPLGVDAPNFEQDAMVWVLEKEEYKRNVTYQPRQWYNPFQEGEVHELEHQRGDLLIHFPGLHEKHAAMGKWLDQVELSPEELQIPINNLTLKADISAFWIRLNSAKKLLQRAGKFRWNKKVMDVLAQNRKLESRFNRAFEILQNVTQQSPYDKDLILKAHSRLNNAMSEISQGRRYSHRPGNANLTANMNRTKLDTHGDADDATLGIVLTNEEVE